MVPKLNALNPVTTAVNIQLPTRCTPALLRPPFFCRHPPDTPHVRKCRYFHLPGTACSGEAHSWPDTIPMDQVLFNNLPPQFPNPSRYGSFSLSIPAFDTSQLYLLLRRRSTLGSGIYHDPKSFRLLRQPSPLLRTCKARRLLSISLLLPSAAKTSAPQCAVSSTRSPPALTTYVAHVQSCLRGTPCTPKM